MVEAVLAITSLVVSIAVAVSQYVLWRRDGPVLQCEAKVTSGQFVITARNVGRGECTLTGFGFHFGLLEYPWITETATRYWPGAGDWTLKPLSSPFPYPLRGKASASWYVPVAELSAAMSALEVGAVQVTAFLATATGEHVRSKASLKLPCNTGSTT